MKNVDDFIVSVVEFVDCGFLKGEIVDELNVFCEIVSWLVE